MLNLSSDLPPPQPIQSLSKLLPPLRGWNPERRPGTPLLPSSGGGTRQNSPPHSGRPNAPPSPEGAGLRDRRCSSGAGPGSAVCATIGREPWTGGCTSRVGPTPLAMSSACCTPKLSIYSTGIEAAGAALASTNHGWDFLFCPLFVSLWDLRRCHRFQSVSRE